MKFKSSVKNRQYLRFFQVLFCSMLLIFVCSANVYVQAEPKQNLPELRGGVYHWDISRGDIICDSSGGIYHITGTTDKYRIIVKNGTTMEPVEIDLQNVHIDLSREDKSDSIKASPLTVERGSVAVIYAGKTDSKSDNFLKGGNDHGSSKSGYAGLCIEEDSYVRLSGEGKLTAIGGGGNDGAAGIGGNDDGAVSALTIEGGITINATGAHGAPGIGSGRDGKLGSIQIVSGTIIAQGGKYAPGIGAGDNVGLGEGGNSDEIEITGGTIIARGGEYGAGIGGSEGGTCKRIKIDMLQAGSIEAYGGKCAAGIGGGDGGDINAIYIDARDKTILATGGENGAGIGGGDHESGAIDIKLEGGTITATGGSNGAGIGGGDADSGIINITGSGSITATGGSTAAGIGAGNNSESAEINIIGTFTKNGQRDLYINAKAYERQGLGKNTAAAIGSGNANGGNITIKNASVNVRADNYGAGIGTGEKYMQTGDEIDKIIIDNCYVRVSGQIPYGAGIGSGEGSRVNHIQILNSDYHGRSIGSGYTVSKMERSANNVESITIKNSNIEAIAGGSDGTLKDHGWAGIGTGPNGEIKNITIEKSTVNAQSYKGGAGIGTGGYTGDDLQIFANNNEVEKILIRDCTVDALANDQGAGIGSGNISSANTIEIVDSTVHANSKNSGAGVGAGNTGSVENIIIKNSKVYAGTVWHAAGIGSGGHVNLFSVTANTHLGNITISDRSVVSSQGGNGGAGVGTGLSAQMKGKITITDSSVYADGGFHAAGIGSGSDGDGGRGGDGEHIYIGGLSKIVAHGGDRGAGIGAGYQGAARDIVLDLETTYTHSFFVEAYGGIGAAGIGSGGIDDGDFGTKKKGYSAENIVIHGGYIYAQGGENPERYGNYGSGAGIGGGHRHGYLRDFTVTGGIIEAVAGGNDARGIGYGGKGGLSNYSKDENFVIEDGTVIASSWSGEAQTTIMGGSVSPNIKNVKNMEGIPVYRTKFLLQEKPYTKIEDLSFAKNRHSYNADSIYTDKDQKVYLYLPVSEEMHQYADFYVNKKADQRMLYVGTTTDDGNGVLKMDAADVEFFAPSGLAAGSSYDFVLDDSDFEGTEFAFEISGCAEIEKVIKDTAPNACVRVKVNSIGSFDLRAHSTNDNPITWGVRARTVCTVNKTVGQIEIVSNPSKTYDTKPISDPEIKTNGDGAVLYKYYEIVDGKSVRVASAPSKAGKYIVYAELLDGPHNTYAMSDRVEFSISPKNVYVALSAAESEGSASVRAEIEGLMEKCGKVKFLITSPSMQDNLEYTVPVAKQTSGAYGASVDFAVVYADTYTVKAEYIPDEKGNYTAAEAAQKTFTKERMSRSISLPKVSSLRYGDSPFQLNPSTDHPTENDTWEFDVVYNEYPEIEGALSVNADGQVRIHHAGTSTIRIRLLENGAKKLYNDTEYFVTLHVQKAPLHVKSEAILNGNAVTTAEYGALDTLRYRIVFPDSSEFKNGDTGETFTHEHGKLQAVPIISTLGVSDTGYEIGIAKIGEDFEVSDKVYKNVFIARDYDLIFENGVVNVTPKELKLIAKDCRSTWKQTPVFDYSTEGFVPWDNIGNVFSTAPKAQYSSDTPYDELLPGTYENAVSVTEGKQNANANNKQNYSVRVIPADLIIGKAPCSLNISVQSKEYDAKPIELQVQSDRIEGYEGEIRVEYYQIEKGKEHLQHYPATKLSNPPQNAGLYYAQASVAENECYLAGTARKYFSIRKANPMPQTPDLSDINYKPGLMLSDEPLPQGWSWKQPCESLDVGVQAHVGIFTPEDTENYRTVESELNFSVLPTLHTQAQDITRTSAQISLYTQENATVYYVCAEQTPTLEQLVLDGNEAVFATGDGTIPVSGLSENTPYTYYLISECNGCFSEMQKVDFTTLPLPEPQDSGDENVDTGDSPLALICCICAALVLCATVLIRKFSK